MTPASQGRAAIRIVDVVLDAARPERRRRNLAFGVIGALFLHTALLLLLVRTQDSLEPWAADLAVRIHAQLAKETVVDLAPPPPPPPPAPPKPLPPPPAEVSAASRSVRPPPPAQAGQVIARSAPAAGPIDLTADTIVTGTATTYAGGVTAATGTNPTAVETRVVDASSPPRKVVDLSTSVALAEGDWRCPWPAEADSAEVDSAEAVVKVEVRSDGTAADARVIRDPGMGFGDAAVRCALRARYEPAHDRTGEAVAALSPPIRVRFTR